VVSPVRTSQVQCDASSEGAKCSDESSEDEPSVVMSPVRTSQVS
jgi:hypothetical protein